jgi:hypothetical protein
VREDVLGLDQESGVLTRASVLSPSFAICDAAFFRRVSLINTKEGAVGLQFLGSRLESAKPYQFIHEPRGSVPFIVSHLGVQLELSARGDEEVDGASLSDRLPVFHRELPPK